MRHNSAVNVETSAAPLIVIAGCIIALYSQPLGTCSYDIQLARALAVYDRERLYIFAHTSSSIARCAGIRRYFLKISPNFSEVCYRFVEKSVFQKFIHNVRPQTQSMHTPRNHLRRFVIKRLPGLMRNVDPA